MIKVTSKQNDYLLQLRDEPKTKKDLMLSFGVTPSTAGMMIKKLKDKGLIISKRKNTGNTLEHSLILPYCTLVKNGLVICNNKTGIAITDEEIHYIAILRNGLMTGQRLKAQHRKIFPKRTSGAIRNILEEAKRRRLCR